LGEWGQLALPANPLNFGKERGASRCIKSPEALWGDEARAEGLRGAGCEAGPAARQRNGLS